MANCSFEDAETNLFTEVSETFIGTEESKLEESINSKVQATLKKIYCFVLIKYKNTIIYSFTDELKTLKDTEKFYKNINSKIKYTNEENLKNIEIKIFTLEEKTENFKVLFKKLKHEFCLLQDQLYPNNKRKLTSYIFKNKLYIFSFLTIILTLTFIFKLNKLGIIINLISIDTITLLININMYFLLITLAIIFVCSFVYVRVIIFIENYLYKLNCNYIYDTPLDTFKLFTNSFTIFYILIITLIVSLEFCCDAKLSPMNVMVKKYIDQTREPSLRRVCMNNQHQKTILLMGKDNKFIYYIYADQINRFLIEEDQRKIVCSDLNRGEFGDLSYIDALIDLLYLKDHDTGFNFIANRRYKMARISDVRFLDELPSFDKMFCNNSEETETDDKNEDRNVTKDEN